MGLSKMTIADSFGNTADVEGGKLTALTVPLEGFKNIEDFAKEVRQAMVKTTPEGQELDPSIGKPKKERKPRKPKTASEAPSGSKRRGKDKPVATDTEKVE
jgi:hypothetical protein